MIGLIVFLVILFGSGVITAAFTAAIVVVYPELLNDFATMAQFVFFFWVGIAATIKTLHMVLMKTFFTR